MKGSLTLVMGVNSILKIDGDSRGTLMSCERGTVSVTQRNDGEDHILTGDDRFIINTKGRVLAWALSGAAIEITFPDADRCCLVERLRRIAFKRVMK